MLLLRRRFDNLSGQQIELDINRFTNCLQIMVTRSHRLIHEWPCIGSVVLIILRSLTFVFFTYSHKTMDIIFTSCLVFLISMVLLLWRSPVYRETISLLDNLSGMEVTRDFSFCGIDWKRSQFILTNDIIINEAITMHRVIYYLVAIPLSLSPFLSYDVNESGHASTGLVNSSSSIQTRDKANSIRAKNSVRQLIPLFCNTCPRIDCLKLIYRQIYMFKAHVSHANTNRANPKLSQKSIGITPLPPLAPIQPNDVSKESVTSDKALAHRRNGYKVFVHENH